MTDTVNCRMAEEQDTAQMQELWLRCFDDTPRFVQWYFERYYRAENTIGIFQGSKLLASAQVIPYRIHLRGQILDSGYVVGVDTAPEARNRGYARTLLQECLQMQRDRKQSISLLMPFEGQFYYRYGWPFCYFHQQIKIMPRELRCAAKPWGNVRQAELQDAVDIMQRIYGAFIQNYDGAVERSAESWKLLLEDAALENTFCYLLEQDGQAEAYCLWNQIKDNGKDTVFIREMAWRCEDARAGMLQFLMEHVPEGQLLWLELPDDDVLAGQLAAVKTAVVRYPFLMARIVDIEPCLEHLCYPQTVTAEFSMAVQDEFAPWNQGVFRVSVQNGKAVVKKEEVAEPDASIADISVTIEGLSQLVMGARSAVQLQKQNQLQAEPPFVQLLQLMWPAQPLYINEYY